MKFRFEIPSNYWENCKNSFKNGATFSAAPVYLEPPQSMPTCSQFPTFTDE